MIFWNQTPNGANKKGIAAFSLIEILIAVGIFASIITITLTVLNRKTKDNRVAVVKTHMAQVHSSAQQAVAKYASLQLPLLIENTANLKACFNETGINCNVAPAPFTGFISLGGIPLSPYQTEMNRRFFGKFYLDQSLCTEASCPIEVNTTWAYDCSVSACNSITFTTITRLNPNAVINSDDRALLSSTPSHETSFVYHATQGFGLKTTLVSNCDSISGLNIQASSVQCADQAKSTNRVLATSVGLEVQSTSLTLPGGDCPVGQTQKLNSDGTIECQTCSTICTKPGAFVSSNCQCCTHGGWGAAFNEEVGSSAHYFNSKLCNNPLPLNCGNMCAVESGYTAVSGSSPLKQRRMVCKANHTFVNGTCKPNATNGGWGPWTISEACPNTLSDSWSGHTQRSQRSCLQPNDAYANSSCSPGQVETRDDKTCMYYCTWYFQHSVDAWAYKTGWLDKDQPSSRGCGTNYWNPSNAWVFFAHMGVATISGVGSSTCFCTINKRF